MQRAIEQFRENIGYVRSLGAIHAALKAQTTPVLDLSDILRAELVMAVSALDHYIHEVVKIGVLEIYDGSRKDTPAFLRFPVRMDNVHQALASPTNTYWLESAIREHYSWQSFQQADKIADAIRLISEIKLWDEIANILGKSPQNVKQQLKLIVDRRNKIAHEADLDPTVPGIRWPIDEVLVNDSVDFIEQLAETIHSLM